MPRYFFNILDGVSEPDTVGTELADVDRARAEAIQLSGQLLRELGANFWDGMDWRLEVADTNGRVLFVLRFSVENGGHASGPAA